MHHQIEFLSVLLVFLLVLSSASLTEPSSNDPFLTCLSSLSPKITDHLYTQTSPHFKKLLETNQQNTRWINTPNFTTPQYILTPLYELEIQAAILCSQTHGLQIRVKCGGHDYEGVSFRAHTNYIIIDLAKFNNVDVNVARETAWIQAGVTLGELYYAIGSKSTTLAFAGGTCPSVGTTGLISGGGFGMLVRKFGLGADNALDARIINAYGQILDRQAMGEDLFWAISGGGAASFGVVTAWKLQLVRVPETLTVLGKTMIMNDSVNAIVHNWQMVAPSLPKEFLIRVFLYLNRDQPQVQIKVRFNGIFLGKKVEFLQLIQQEFPSLGMTEADCYEVPWIDSVKTYFGRNSSREMLLNRTDHLQQSYKAKSDYVVEPIPKEALQTIWDKYLLKSPSQYVIFVLEPFGGRMDEISESSLPYPYRKGFIYNFQYIIKWNGNDTTAEASSVKWLRELYQHMELFVPNSPRGAYINYRDLDLGTNQLSGHTSFGQALQWGEKYFRGNFKRLAKIKGRIDPLNVFNNEQSVPPLYS